MNLRNQDHSIKKKQNIEEDEKVTEDLKKKVKGKFGKNKPLLYYNGRLFSYAQPDGNYSGNRCTGCFFSRKYNTKGKRNCPMDADKNFSCFGVVLKLVKVK